MPLVGIKLAYEMKVWVIPEMLYWKYKGENLNTKLKSKDDYPEQSYVLE